MSSLFSSISNKKLVIQWKKEHREIVASANKIIKAYKTNKLNMLRKEMENLNELTLEHLMDEDMEFYKFLMLGDSLDDKIKELIEDFIETFEKTKATLMDFLTKYTLSDAVYDQEFIDDFKMIVGLLSQRITYEEKTLYKALQEK
ncbi:MAG: hemerythrin domain-containing protein [Sulfurimonas sp.]|nr:hemerythrin domain-containing protein [Sulfurimonas sp.]